MYREIDVCDAKHLGLIKKVPTSFIDSVYFIKYEFEHDDLG